MCRIAGGGRRTSGLILTPANADQNLQMMQEPNTAFSIAIAAWAGWMMMRAGVAKNLLEERRRHRRCPSCGRTGDGRCRCTESHR
jgi:hypothetical protein